MNVNCIVTMGLVPEIKKNILYYRRAPRGGCCSGGRSLRSLYAEFRARNHEALERIDIVVGHGRSGVP